jgi:hypothetical protein
VGHLDTCGYTQLRTTGAVHSDDLTSAPAPLGASEFVDVDVDQLATAGARYAVVSILSYNDVAFTDMAEAFAGFMLRAATPHSSGVFDARAVEQRFDLTGPGKVTIPFVVDLAERTMRWSWAAGRRQLGPARCWSVTVTRITRFRRREHEPVDAFTARLATGDGDGEAVPGDTASAALQLLVRGDLPAPDGAEVYALHPAGWDAAKVRLLAAADLAGMLTPSM